MGSIQRALAIEPELVDCGAPDFYGTGWVMSSCPEVVTGTIYIERVECGIIRRYVVCRAHFPRSAWMRAINTTLIGVKGGHGH